MSHELLHQGEEQLKDHTWYEQTTTLLLLDVKTKCELLAVIDILDAGAHVREHPKPHPLLYVSCCVVSPGGSCCTHSHLPQTQEQFVYNGCDNCERHLKMKGNRELVQECTSSNYDG